MRVTTLLMLVLCLHLTMFANGQEKITVVAKNTVWSKALSAIEKASNYRFVYSSDIAPVNKKIDLVVRDADLPEVMDKLLSSTSLSYKVMPDNLVVLFPKVEFAPEITVKGRITDENGSPLAGASVRVKGSNTGVSANSNGEFSITVPDNAVLIFSYVGYDEKQISVSGQSTINVTLNTSVKVQDQVVVIGYGTAAKRDLTGSIVKISGKEVADRPNTNPISSLQGKVAGLSIVNSGTPGQAPDIRIRGTISIGSVTPLYVVDGVFNDNIDYINPNDIESIEILKDPSSLAIFGVRGAAGVIAITTKKAKTGQITINLNSSYGFKKLVDKIELADADQFKTLFEEEKANLNTPIPPFDYTPWTANTDWIDAVTRTANFSATNLSVSGSSERNKFTMGVGYTFDEGIIKHERLEKILFSLNDEFRISKGIKVGFNFNGVRQDNPYFNARYMLDEARKVIPIVPSGTKTVYTKNPYGLDSMNQNLYYELPSIQNSGVVNPLIELENQWDKTKSIEYRMVSSVFAEIVFLKDFNFRTTLYGDMSNVNTRKYTPLYNSYDVVTNSVFLVSPSTKVNEDDNTYKKFQQDYILTYKKKFGGSHNITASAGFTTYYFGNFNRSGSVNQSSTGSAIPDDERFWYISNGFGDPQSQRASSSQSENSTASGLVRVLYNYQGKYYLNGSFRRDGSSQISPANRWQNFWAVGGAWEMTRENFMSSQKLFDFIKIKASIGVLGNQNTYGYPYPFYPGLRTGSAAVFGNNIYNAYSQAYLPDPNLKWESVHAKEIGFELSAFTNRLHVDAAYYDKVTKDLMTYIPGINGASDGLTNIGSIKNNGVELSASWIQKFSKDLSVTVSGNFTTYHNEVLELATKDFAIVSGYNRTVVGQPIGSFYGYIVEGIYQSYSDKLGSPVNTEFSYGPGDLKYKDVNGDGKINTADRTFIGNPTPDFAYGGTISVNFKGFDLGMDVGGVYGNEIYRNWGGTESPFQRVNYAAFKINRWHGEGTSNWDPILGQDHRINYESSTYGIEDGSYFRIRNLQLGYNFNPSSLMKYHVKNLRLFANVQNLKTWKNNSGYTPEFGGSAISFGVDNAGGALPMVTTFGINVSF
ncbi:MAG TPA: SusC/RagA family TonB-linked outer membrane protein [Chitinophagaceae bacterium]|nr:SusC/RagA family TonB-linked outer membrane protein [Chitinophagaceae bacterium]